MNKASTLPLALGDRIRALGLKTGYARHRYEPGEQLTYNVTAMHPAESVEVTVEVELYAGSGFAGQVYRVRIVPGAGTERLGLSPDARYGLKVYRPVSRFGNLFRDALFYLGFGFPFAPRCYEPACRSNALWQKFLHAVAPRILGTDACISDVYGTLYDPRLRAYGVLKEWVEGRPWRLEIDDRLLDRPSPARTPDYREPAAFSSEYVAKRFFMARLVRLLHEVGIPGLARQFEWGTWKSQPNILKRDGRENGPYDGLTAVDFQAGLALLPFFPMSPADFRLIARGLIRGRFVQFDHSDMRALDRFTAEHPDIPDAALALLEELRSSDRAYRMALPDLTNLRLPFLFTTDRRRSIARAYRESWVNRGLVTKERSGKLVGVLAWWTFYLAGLVPILGKLLRKGWGDPAYAAHLLGLFRPAYFSAWLRGLRYQALIRWYHAGRCSEQHLDWLADQPLPFLVERVLLSWIPVWWVHRALTDWRWTLSGIKFGLTQPFRLLFKREVREEWLLGHLEDGRKQGMVTDEEAEEVRSQMTDRFVQEYLKCLAVHVCTLPVTQVVAVALGAGLAYYHGWSYEKGAKAALLLLAAFAVAPISPGSITRGLYVVYVVIRQREFKRYRVALVLSFWKYVGYLAFPIQTVTTYPTLSRFMASRWATGFVRVVPVFGEAGALLQHKAFDAFYNLPISIRRRWQEKRAASD